MVLASCKAKGAQPAALQLAVMSRLELELVPGELVPVGAQEAVSPGAGTRLRVQHGVTAHRSRLSENYTSAEASGGAVRESRTAP